MNTKKHNPIPNPNSRTRTFSFSSSSISSSLSSSSRSSGYNYPDESPISPATPLRFIGKPFSWEYLPGVPKKNSIHKKKEDSTFLIKELPLPPPTTPPSISKIQAGNCKKLSNSQKFFIKDPFVAALVQCSKDGDEEEDDSSTNSNSWGNNRITRSISDRFGFVNLYSSCKRTCAVSESIVYLPRSDRSSYDLIGRSRRF